MSDGGVVILTIQWHHKPSYRAIDYFRINPNLVDLNPPIDLSSNKKLVDGGARFITYSRVQIREYDLVIFYGFRLQSKWAPFVDPPSDW